MKHSYLLAVCLICMVKLSAQLVPSDVYLLTLKGESQLIDIQYLNHFNKNAYNNQASFGNDGDIYMTSLLSDDQTDIVTLSPTSSKWARLTDTEESEYSPAPYLDDYFTVVRVEKDEKTQSLWRYPIDLSDNGERLMEDLSNIGYYQMLPNFKVALFVLDGPDKFNLVIGDLRNGTHKQVSKNIGRTFQITKTGELLFIIKDGKDHYIMSYNSLNRQIKEVVKTQVPREDFALHGSAEDIIMSFGSRIYKYDKQKNEWFIWLELKDYNLEDITRIETKGNQLLLVNQKNKYEGQSN